MKNTTNNVVGQGIGAGIAHLNQLCAEQLLANLNEQDMNLENAIAELDALRSVVNGTLQGRDNTVHGIIAEYTQVHFSNARAHVVGKEPTYFKEPNLGSPIDYWNGDTPIQSKFIGGANSDGFQTIKQTLTNKRAGIVGHLSKYPHFLKDGGIYQVPKDQYEYALDLLSKPTTELSRADYNTVQSIREFERANNVKFEDVVKPSVAKYSEVQKNVIGDTIDKEEASVVETDEIKRVELCNQAKATIKQGAQVAVVSAAIEGTLSFGITVITKFKQGKKINDFTEEDWKEIFSNTTGGVVKGGVRGASVYALTNLTKSNAATATALVTITIGAITLTTKFAKSELSSKEYIDNLQQLGVETGVSAATATIGQTLIPVPVVGALVGSMVGNMILGGIQRAAARDLQDSQFLVDVETAYTGTVGKIYESTQIFVNALDILAFQHEDFSQKQIMDKKSTKDLKSLYDSI